MTETTASSLSAVVLLELHHERLDDMLGDVKLMADAESWQDAKRRFDAFRRELEAHIRLEEEMMFPALEKDASMPQGPTTVMRAEHVTIRAFLAELDEALTETRSVRQTTAELEAQIGAHNFKEERVLYPAFERLAPASARTALATELEALLGGRGRTTG